MAQSWAFAKVLDGDLVEASDGRLEFVVARRLSVWAWTGIVSVVLAALWVLVVAGVISPETAALIWALPSAIFWGGAMGPMAIRGSNMLCLRRRLVIERQEARSAKELPTFVIFVDGAPLGPATRRALYEVRHAGLVLHVLAFADRAIALPWFESLGPRMAAMVEHRKATQALLRAERGFEDVYRTESMVPLIQAVVRVLDLSPVQTGGDVEPYELRNAGRLAESEDAPPPSRFGGKRLVLMGINFLSMAWQFVVWTTLAPRLIPFGPVIATFAFGLVLVGPPAATLIAVLRAVYLRPLNSKANEIVRHADEAGPSLVASPPRGGTQGT